jgi:hypothetical protein
MYSQWDMTVRELGGGVWFFSNIALAAVLSAWAFSQCFRRDRCVDPLVALAVAMATVLFGSSIRGFLTWQQFRVAGNGGDPSFWIATWPLLGSSVILNIVGAAACTWLILPERWRTPITIVIVAVAIIVPFSIFYLA